MKLIAKNDFIYGAMKVRSGDVFEVDEEKAGFLLAQGWAEEVKAEKPKAPAKKKK